MLVEEPSGDLHDQPASGRGRVTADEPPRGAPADESKSTPSRIRTQFTGLDRCRHT